MDRRDFIKHTGAVAAAATVGIGTQAAIAAQPAQPSAPRVGKNVRELRLTMPWMQNGRGFDDSARRLAQSISVLSDGRYRISVMPQAESLAALADGQADLYHGSGHDFVALDRAFAYFAGLPGPAAMRPTYFNAWLAAAGGQQLWDDLAARHSFKPLLAGHSGARAKLWSREPIAGLADLQGRRIAAAGITADIVRELGAEPVAIASNDLGAALADGRVDAVEWGGTLSGFACDLHLAARHCLRPGLSRGGSSTVLAVRSGLWAELPAADQALITAAAAQELNTVVAESLSVSHGLRLALAERHDITFAPMPADITASAAQSAKSLVASIADGSAEAARIHASLATFRTGLPGKRRQKPEAAIA